MMIQMKQLVGRVIPSLTNEWRKGQNGRIGVIGGCLEYTGAPFYAGMASLKTGGDLCHIFCAEEAAIPIKSYSPELIVHPYLPTERSLGLDKRDEKWQHEVGAAVDKIAEVLPRLDTLVIGPGLGRDAVMQEITRRLIGEAKTLNLPLVLDGDALYLVSLEPQLIQGYQNTILTPNAMEYARLCATKNLLQEPDPVKAKAISPKILSQLFGHPVILQKGQSDIFSDGFSIFTNDEFGSPRRSGGQGDILTGCIATFVSWLKTAPKLIDDEHSELKKSNNPLLVAVYGGSLLTRASAQEAFKIHQRSTTSPDILQSIGKAFPLAFSQP